MTDAVASAPPLVRDLAAADTDAWMKFLSTHRMRTSITPRFGAAR